MFAFDMTSPVLIKSFTKIKADTTMSHTETVLRLEKKKKKKKQTAAWEIINNNIHKADPSSAVPRLLVKLTESNVAYFKNIL